MKSTKLNSFFLIFFIFFFTYAHSQTKFSLNFHNKFVQKEFDEKFLSEFKRINNLDSALQFIEVFLLQRGFLSFETEIDTIQSDTLENYLIKVNEGKRFVISSIDFTGDNFVTEDARKINSLFDRAVFNQKNVNEISLQIVEQLETRGFPFAEAKFLSYRVIEESDEEKFVKIIFKISKNLPARIDKVEIKGNKYTSKDVIVRELRISKGELFTPELSKKILSRLNRLNIFSSVGNPEFYFDEDENGILEIEVKEGNTNSFDGIIGYVPSTNPKEKGYVTGQVNVSLRNLFGTFRAFSFRWNRLNKLTQDLEIKYFEPWLFGYPINVQPTFSQFKQDTSYIQRTFSSSFEFFFSENFGLMLNAATSSVIPQVEYNVTNINRSSSLAYGLGVFYDTRDNPIYTKSGFLFRTDFNQIIKKDYLPQELKKFYQQKANLSFSIYQLVFKNQMIYFSLNAKVINGGGLSLSDLFRFGGMNSLRGYAENQFIGSRIFWSNLEYRFLTTYTDYISAFFDYGYYYRDIQNEKVSNFKYGYGVGAGFQTALGLLKVNFALGQGDTFSRGKIHFGIVSGF